METVGIRELKENISRYLKKVRSGEQIIVTDRKREIAMILPMNNRDDQEEKLYHLIRRGKATWSGNMPAGMSKRIALKRKTVSSAVIEDRR